MATADTVQKSVVPWSREWGVIGYRRGWRGAEPIWGWYQVYRDAEEWEAIKQQKQDHNRCTCGIAEMSPKDWFGAPEPKGNPHAKDCPRWKAT